MIAFLLNQLATFTGPAWEQEDDVTLVALHRQAHSAEQQAPLERRKETLA
ncbi:MAG TPA: hypothetical protein VH590_04695 [Ktedonobacterales bacterium]